MTWTIPSSNGSCHREWEEACVPRPTLETLNDSFGHYDPDELDMFRQRLDKHLAAREQERDGSG